MEDWQEEKVLERAKVILDLTDDDSKDGLLSVYMENARDYILAYTKIEEIPSSLHTLIAEMIVFQYRQRGVENIASESKGSLSESYIQDYPNNIAKRLNPFKRALFL